ncbi:MAG: hypothetical protein WBP98_01825, partial [Candidatus Sulfotelmatobacter sp.]
SPENLPSIGLLLAGIGGICVAIRTLKAVERQVQTQRESLRARLTIGFGESVFEIIKQGRMPHVVAKFINTGGIPAYRVEPETWIEVASYPFTDFSPSAVYYKGSVFSVYPSQPIMYDIPLTRRLTPEEIEGMANVKRSIYVRIRLTYETLGDSKYCDFAYAALPTGMEQLSKYRKFPNTPQPLQPPGHSR